MREARSVPHAFFVMVLKFLSYLILSHSLDLFR
jgi:hypothetical protein